MVSKSGFWRVANLFTCALAFILSIVWADWVAMFGYLAAFVAQGVIIEQAATIEHLNGNLKWLTEVAQNRF